MWLLRPFALWCSFAYNIKNNPARSGKTMISAAGTLTTTYAIYRNEMWMNTVCVRALLLGIKEARALWSANSEVVWSVLQRKWWRHCHGAWKVQSHWFQRGDQRGSWRGTMSSLKFCKGEIFSPWKASYSFIWLSTSRQSKEVESIIYRDCNLWVHWKVRRSTKKVDPVIPVIRY